MFSDATCMRTLSFAVRCDVAVAPCYPRCFRRCLGVVTVYLLSPTICWHYSCGVVAASVIDPAVLSLQLPVSFQYPHLLLLRNVVIAAAVNALFFH